MAKRKAEILNEIRGVIIPGLKVVDVRFDGNRTVYSYLTTADVERQDRVVVQSPYGGMTVVVVSRVHKNFKSRFRLQWVVQAIDRTEYLRRRDADKTLEQSFKDIPKAPVDELIRSITLRDCGLTEKAYDFLGNADHAPVINTYIKEVLAHEA